MSDTIAAVATPFGPGAIAILRVSGTSAHEVAGLALRGGGGAKIPARKVLRAQVCDKDGAILDEVLATFFCGPASYTGENTVEISCHGGVLVTQRILERLVECGARVARAGEFSLRANIFFCPSPSTGCTVMRPNRRRPSRRPLLRIFFLVQVGPPVAELRGHFVCRSPVQRKYL